LLVHEQNSTPGWANKYLASRAAVVALTYEDARAALTPGRQTQVVLTGNPVRKAFTELADVCKLAEARLTFREQLAIPSDALLLLVFGGSQGARHINTAVIGLAERLLALPNLHVVQITGPKEFESVKSQQGAATTRWHLLDYCTQMPAAFAAADLVVARAGASSLAEIAAIGLPAVLVPYPHATNNHQVHNARSLVEVGAAALVLDSDLEAPVFSATLFELLENDERRAQMAQAAKVLQAKDATQEVCTLLLSIAGVLGHKWHQE
jgi:UDP-N-acetylglucosamine--N-acetylmuramyl-(pentapeptide) pyrophosphoryl-undecaprenol N-acetylglucosamine transferase